MSQTSDRIKELPPRSFVSAKDLMAAGFSPVELKQLALQGAIERRVSPKTGRIYYRSMNEGLFPDRRCRSMRRSE